MVMGKLCDCLDVGSIVMMEQSCILLRKMVVENRVYRRKVSAAIRGGLWTSGGWLRKTKDDPGRRDISKTILGMRFQKVEITSKIIS